MLEGPSVAGALIEAGATHVVWIPDSELGQWEQGFAQASRLKLVRVCREGEAIAIAGGLMLGGQKPVVVIQCTGLFEAGDALRNVVHDLRLPLFLIVGVRGYLAHQRRATVDTCPLFTEPILDAWRIPHVLLDNCSSAGDLKAAYMRTLAGNQAGAALIAE